LGESAPKIKFSWYWAKSLNSKYWRRYNSKERRDQENGLYCSIGRRGCIWEKENKVKREIECVWTIWLEIEKTYKQI
jgi:hypothetical protein